MVKNVIVSLTSLFSQTTVRPGPIKNMLQHDFHIAYSRRINYTTLLIVVWWFTPTCTCRYKTKKQTKVNSAYPRDHALPQLLYDQASW